MKPYDIGIRIAQRFLYGYLHHSQMAGFFDLLKMPITAHNQRKNACMDAHKREKMDEYISTVLEMIPTYTVSNLHTIAQELPNATYADIKENKAHWLKKGVEGLANYEKETITLYEQLKKEAEEAKEPKLVKLLEKYIDDAKEELEQIEHFYKELQEHDFDYDKFKKEKGDKEMPRRYYSDDRYDDRYDDEYDRRRRMDMDDRYDDRYDDSYEPMGFADRYRERDDWFLPFMDDRERHEMEMRRGVPGTGRGRRRRYR